MENIEDILALITPSNSHNTELMEAILEYVHAMVLVEVVKAHLASEKQKKKEETEEGLGLAVLAKKSRARPL